MQLKKETMLDQTRPLEKLSQVSLLPREILKCIVTGLLSS